MSKIIIHNRSDKSDEEACRMVGQVIAMGRKSNDGKQYCYLTTFSNGAAISTDLNKDSDRFTVWELDNE